MDNRYSPPKSAVADITPEHAALKERPQQIVLAMRLVIGSYVIGLLSMVIDWDYYVSLQPLSKTVIRQLITTALLAWLYWKVYLGRNWARIVLLVSAVLGLLMIFSGPGVRLMAAAPITARILMWFSTGITLVVLWLLFLSPGREWFRKR